MVRSVAGNLPEQVKNNQSVNTAAGNGGQKMSQYSWFTVYENTSIKTNCSLISTNYIFLNLDDFAKISSLSGIKAREKNKF